MSKVCIVQLNDTNHCETAPAPGADWRNRAAFLPVPGFALNALYGGMAQLVITGQRVGLERLERMRFGFRCPRLEPALLDVLIDA